MLNLLIGFAVGVVTGGVAAFVYHKSVITSLNSTIQSLLDKLKVK